MKHLHCCLHVCFCSETIMFLHQIFYQGLKARIASWPTLVLGECTARAVGNQQQRTFCSPLKLQASVCIKGATDLTLIFLPVLQLTYLTSCCPCWTSTRSLCVITSTACRSWPTASRTATSTSCWNSMKPSLTVRNARLRHSSLIPCFRWPWSNIPTLSFFGGRGLKSVVVGGILCVTLIALTDW